MREIAHEQRPGDTVVSVPADCDPSFVTLQVFHRAPVVGCAASFAANPWSKLRADADNASFDKLLCDPTTYGRLTPAARPDTPFGPADVSELRQRLGVRFVVLDHTKLGPSCPRVDAALAVLRRYRSLGGDARYEVIDIAAPAG